MQLIKVSCKEAIMSKFQKGDPELYSYHGVPYTPHFPADVIDRIGEYAFDPNDVFVATYPKAGTTWMAAIVNLVLSEGKDIGGGPAFLEIKYSKECQSVFDMETAKPPPRLFQTHLQFRFLRGSFEKSKPKVICVFRNPFDNLVSFYHFTRMNEGLGLYQGSWNEFFDEIYSKDKLCFGDYFEHVSGWWEARLSNSDHILFVKYEDMVKDPRDIITKVANFLGKNVDEEIMQVILDKTAFDSMKANPKVNKQNLPHMKQNIVPFMRKGKVGDWNNYFTDQQFESIHKLYQEKLVSNGLDFEFGDKE